MGLAENIQSYLGLEPISIKSRSLPMGQAKPSIEVASEEAKKMPLNAPAPERIKSTSASDTTRTTETEKYKEVGAITPGVYQDLQARAFTFGPLQDQAGQLDQFKAKLQAAINTPAKADLAPLMALGDFATRGRYNLQKGYKPPMSEAERQQMLGKLEAVALKGQAGLTKSYTDFMSAQLKNVLQGGTVAGTSATSTTSTGLPPKGDTFTKKDVEKYKTQFNKDPSVIKIRGYAKYLRKLRDFKAALDKAGGAKILPGKERSEQESKYSAIVTDYNRDIAKLGALAGADLDLIKAGIWWPLSLQDIGTYQLPGGGDERVYGSLENNIQEIEKGLAEEMNVVKTTHSTRGIPDMLEQLDTAVGNSRGGGGGGGGGKLTPQQRKQLGLD